MNKIAALLLATTAISAATPGIADTYDPSLDQDDAFFWMDEESGASAPVASDTGAHVEVTKVNTRAPDQVAAPAETTALDATRAPVAAPTEARPTGGLKDPVMPGAPETSGKPAPTKPVNPIMETYPEASAPQYHVPEGGSNEGFEAGCRPGETRTGVQPEDRHLIDPEMRRRGDMTGDDGVLEVIQDTPCAIFHRRGGPTAESEREYTDPNDIRRANTLEERRIPIHEVGRYTAEGSSLWHRDPQSPFIDASTKWTVERGTMLSHMLMDWGDQAGFNVVWRSPYDYILEADVIIHGTFPEAAGKVLESYANAQPPITGDLFLSNRVLVVDSASEFDGR